jgi:hypothetical protein
MFSFSMQKEHNIAHHMACLFCKVLDKCVNELIDLGVMDVH